MAGSTSALSGMIAVTSELFPSMSNTMGARWRAFERPASGRQQVRVPQRPQAQQLHQMNQSRSISSRAGISKSSTLPECLADLPPSFASSLTPRSVPRQPPSVQNIAASIPRRTFAALNPIAGRIAGIPVHSRQMSTASQFRPRLAATPFVKIHAPQTRTLFGSSTSRNLLAHVEETANRNPNSATAQNAFYQALLRANMPAIIVERYQTHQFATNAATDAAYHKALAALGHVDGVGGHHHGVQNGNNLSNMQLQSIGQAVAASSRGGNVAVSRGSNGTGGKDSPIHVVVEETIGGAIFKWVKFIVYFGLVMYISLILATLVIESLGALRKVGSRGGDNQAKAEHQNVKFSDVHGCDEAKEELQELVEFLKNPESFSTLGGKLPKGVLLVGPPGTGKTLLARAVAGEAGVPFFFMSGSEFDEVYVGVGAKRVRELFTAAKSKAPAIVFIDELDAIGGKRNARDAAYVKQTLNQLLTELDGFEQSSNVIILAATNFPELLDKALVRPGRFDRHVVVDLPDVRGRMAILKHHIKKIKLANDVSLESIAAGTVGFSGAELENIVNQAAVHASKAKAQAVSMFDLEWARDKVMMGAEKKSMVISEKEKEMTAYHEAGHALVAMFTPGTVPLHKITIMPRGLSLGMTNFLPEMDKYSTQMVEYQAQIDVALGGKVAEELIYGPDKVTSGVSQDLKQATNIAYTMVTRLGMSSSLGNVDLASNQDRLSGSTRNLIDAEVRRLIEEGRVRAYTLLESKRKELDFLAKALVNYETLSKEEAFKVITGEKLPGRLIMSSGSIKVPNIGQTPLDGELAGVPQIPGSTPDDESGGKTPPSAVA